MKRKVFISHASEDKERFVLEFAEKLLSKGIDAWVDKWEILPGDSLIGKIFEEGIKNAQAIIVIVSKFSIDKPWVQEELNIGVVRKINGESKLIPVVIDDCEVPECLKSTVWQRIKDTNNYDKEFDQIVMSVFGHYDKPEIGNPPPYIETIVDIIPSLTKIDNQIFKICCETVIKMDHHDLSEYEIRPRIEQLGIGIDQLNESLQILDENGYIQDYKFELGGRIPDFSPSVYGFQEFAKLFVKDYELIVKKVGYEIVNNNIDENFDNFVIAKSLKQPDMIIEHILDLFASERLIEISKANAGMIYIDSVSPSLRRRLERNSE